MLHRIMDKLMPDNCRTQLKNAAEENRQVREEAMCVIQTVRHDIKKRLSHHAA